MLPPAYRWSESDEPGLYMRYRCVARVERDEEGWYVMIAGDTTFKRHRVASREQGMRHLERWVCAGRSTSR